MEEVTELVKIKPYSIESIRPSVYLSHVITISNLCNTGETPVRAVLREMLADWTFEVYHGYGLNPDDNQRLDDRMRQAGKKNYSVLSGVAPHVLVPHAFHVLLFCPLVGRVMRLFRSRKSNERINLFFREVKGKDSIDVGWCDRQYSGWKWRKEDFDFVADTDGDKYPAKKLAKDILAGHQEWKEKMRMGNLLISPLDMDQTLSE